MTKRNGLHYPVANYFGITLGPSPIMPHIAYSVMAEDMTKLVVCNDDHFCQQVSATSENVRNSCFAASEIHDDMDDTGSLTHSHVYFLLYVCPGSMYGKWLSYSMENEPYKKALRLKLFDDKADASPWRLYKDVEGHKLQCFLDGPGKDHWVGVDKKTGTSVLVPHADSAGHSAFVFAMVADASISSRLSYAVFHEASKGFLTCLDQHNGVCKVAKKQEAVDNSCWSIQRKDETGTASNDLFSIKYVCSNSTHKGSYLSAVTDPETKVVHVGLLDGASSVDSWKIQKSSKGAGFTITLMTGKYKGYRLGPGKGAYAKQKEFFFIRRVSVSEEEVEQKQIAIEIAEPKSEEQKEMIKSEMPKPEKDSNKYSTKAAKFLGCYVDKWSRDLPAGPRTWGYNVATCRKACMDSFIYFGLQGGSWCSCGNKFGKYGKAGAEGLCLNEQGQMHGGNWANAIYEVIQ